MSELVGDEEQQDNDAHRPLAQLVARICVQYWRTPDVHE